MSVRCDIEIPEKVIKMLGFRESEISELLKRELSAYFF
jgi:hypothetical protein